MRIIAVGDTHGRDKWRRVADNELESCDKFVFIGDYFDSYDIPTRVQWMNFVEILDFKRKFPDKVELLLGNHDFHYLAYTDEQYSGWNSVNNLTAKDTLTKAFEDGEINVCYGNEDIIFSHAGISDTWASNNGVPLDNAANYINDYCRENPLSLRFTPGRNFSNSGNDITQTPIWIRPGALAMNPFGNYMQVFGHTTVTKIANLVDGLWMIDAIESNQYFIYDDSQEEKITLGFI